MALSVLPISELRGAIPYAYFNGIELWTASSLSIVSNCLIPLFGFFFFETINKLFLKIPFYKRFFEKTIIKAQSKVGEKVQKYGLWGLMVFVAIPLPITGAWTGTLGAWVLGLDKKKSKLSIILGVFVAGLIVTLVVLTGSSLSSLFTKSISI